MSSCFVIKWGPSAVGVGLSKRWHAVAAARCSNKHTTHHHHYLWWCWDASLKPSLDQLWLKPDADLINSIEIVNFIQKHTLSITECKSKCQNPLHKMDSGHLDFSTTFKGNSHGLDESKWYAWNRWKPHNLCWTSTTSTSKPQQQYQDQEWRPSTHEWTTKLLVCFLLFGWFE